MKTSGRIALTGALVLFVSFITGMCGYQPAAQHGCMAGGTLLVIAAFTWIWFEL